MCRASRARAPTLLLPLPPPPAGVGRSARETANTYASSTACERAEMGCEEVLDREARQHLPSSGRFKARYDECSARFRKACVGPALEHNAGECDDGGREGAVRCLCEAGEQASVLQRGGRQPAGAACWLGYTGTLFLLDALTIPSGPVLPADSLPAASCRSLVCLQTACPRRGLARALGLAAITTTGC